MQNNGVKDASKRKTALEEGAKLVTFYIVDFLDQLEIA
jgi:hypothetical protein